jgi:hypothetical protein
MIRSEAREFRGVKAGGLMLAFVVGSPLGSSGTKRMGFC